MKRKGTVSLKLEILHVWRELDACDDVSMASEGAHQLGVSGLGVIIRQRDLLFGLRDG